MPFIRDTQLEHGGATGKIKSSLLECTLLTTSVGCQSLNKHLKSYTHIYMHIYTHTFLHICDMTSQQKWYFEITRDMIRYSINGVGVTYLDKNIKLDLYLTL